MNFCACVGPEGACPCILGEDSKITEINIAADVFDLLTTEEKNQVNELKMRAFGRYFANQNSTKTHKE